MIVGRYTPPTKMKISSGCQFPSEILPSKIPALLGLKVFQAHHEPKIIQYRDFNQFDNTSLEVVFKIFS